MRTSISFYTFSRPDLILPLILIPPNISYALFLVEIVPINEDQEG